MPSIKVTLNVSIVFVALLLLCCDCVTIRLEPDDDLAECYYLADVSNAWDELYAITKLQKESIEDVYSCGLTHYLVIYKQSQSTKKISWLIVKGKKIVGDGDLLAPSFAFVKGEDTPVHDLVIPLHNDDNFAALNQYIQIKYIFPLQLWKAEVQRKLEERHSAMIEVLSTSEVEINKLENELSVATEQRYVNAKPFLNANTAIKINSKRQQRQQEEHLRKIKELEGRLSGSESAYVQLRRDKDADDVKVKDTKQMQRRIQEQESNIAELKGEMQEKIGEVKALRINVEALELYAKDLADEIKEATLQATHDAILAGAKDDHGAKDQMQKVAAPSKQASVSWYGSSKRQSQPFEVINALQENESGSAREQLRSDKDAELDKLREKEQVKRELQRLQHENEQQKLKITELEARALQKNPTELKQQPTKSIPNQQALDQKDEKINVLEQKLQNANNEPKSVNAIKIKLKEAKSLLQERDGKIERLQLLKTTLLIIIVVIFVGCIIIAVFSYRHYRKAEAYRIQQMHHYVTKYCPSINGTIIGQDNVIREEKHESSGSAFFHNSHRNQNGNVHGLNLNVQNESIDFESIQDEEKAASVSRWDSGQFSTSLNSSGMVRKMIADDVLYVNHFKNMEKREEEIRRGMLKK